MEAAEYPKMAEVEDRMWYFRSLHAHVRRELRRRLGDRPGKVLDAGCGTGGLARSRCRAEIVEGSVTALPFGAAAFDAIVAADVLYELKDPDLALREFRRCLRPGGWVVVNLPAYRWLWSYHDVAVHSQRRYVRREAASLLRGAGFVVELNTHWNALPFPLIVARRKLFARANDTSDVKLHHAAVEAFFRGLMAVEHGWLRLGGRWAWGSSILAVGRRPG